MPLRQTQGSLLVGRSQLNSHYLTNTIFVCAVDHVLPPPFHLQPKERVSKYDESRGFQAADEGPLDDPIAEKLRQQRLVEEADYESTMELFGKERNLEGFIPKSVKDFEDMSQTIVAKYFLPNHKGNAAQYKAGVKVLLRHVLRPMSAAEVKDVESAVAGIRADKLKEEKLAAGGKKTLKKAALNVGRTGASAGLDDYVYDDPLDDDFDFM